MKRLWEIVVSIAILAGVLVAFAVIVGGLCAIGYKVFLWVV